MMRTTTTMMPTCVVLYLLILSTISKIFCHMVAAYPNNSGYHRHNHHHHNYPLDLDYDHNHHHHHHHHPHQQPVTHVFGDLHFAATSSSFVKPNDFYREKWNYQNREPPPPPPPPPPFRFPFDDNDNFLNYFFTDPHYQSYSEMHDDGTAQSDYFRQIWHTPSDEAQNRPPLSSYSGMRQSGTNYRYGGGGGDNRYNDGSSPERAIQAAVVTHHEHRFYDVSNDDDESRSPPATAEGQKAEEEEEEAHRHTGHNRHRKPVVIDLGGGDERKVYPISIYMPTYSTPIDLNQIHHHYFHHQSRKKHLSFDRDSVRHRRVPRPYRGNHNSNNNNNMMQHHRQNNNDDIKHTHAHAASGIKAVMRDIREMISPINSRMYRMIRNPNRYHRKNVTPPMKRWQMRPSPPHYLPSSIRNH